MKHHYVRLQNHCNIPTNLSRDCYHMHESYYEASHHHLSQDESLNPYQNGYFSNKTSQGQNVREAHISGDHSLVIKTVSTA